MPITKVKSPDGEIIEVEHPEGATEQEIINYAQQTHKRDDVSFSAGIRVPEKESSPFIQGLSEKYHTALPAVGGVTGSVLGGGGALIAGNLGPQALLPEEAVTVPLGMVEGGALGSSLGANFADVLDGLLGVKPPRTWEEVASDTAKNGRDAIIGEEIGVLLPPALKLAKPALKAVKKVIPSGRRVISDFYENAVSPVDAEHILRAETVKKNVPGYQTTQGMLTGNTDIKAMERGAVASPHYPGLDSQINELKQGNIRAVKNSVGNLVDGSTDDFTKEIQRQKTLADIQREKLSNVDPQATGKQFLDSVSGAKEPVQKTMGELAETIPDYPMQATNFRKQSSKILSTKMKSIEARNLVRAKVKEFERAMAQDGETTHSLIGFRKGLNDLIGKLDGEEQAAMLQLKKGIDDDFLDLSSQARTGQLKVYNGKVYHPDELAQQIEEKAVRLAELKTVEKPDIKTMAGELGGMRNGWAQLTGESEDGFAQRVIKGYTKKFGATKTIGASAEEMKRLAGESKNLRELLSKLEPGQDVAALYNAYNHYASTKYFARFKTGSIKSALRGNTNTENISKIFNNPTGVNDLIHAIGKDEASDIMRKHYQASFSNLLSKNPQNQAITQWYKANIRQMQKLGLNREFAETVRTQIGYREAEKILNTDPGSIFEMLYKGQRHQQQQFIDSTMKKLGGNSRAKNGFKKAFTEYLDDKMIIQNAGDNEGFGRVNSIIDSLEPTINRLFTTSEKAQLKNIQDAVKIQQNWTMGNSLGNSITSEISQKQAERIINGRKVNPVIESLFGLVFGSVGAKTGGTFGAVTAATSQAAVRQAIRKYGDNAVRNVFKRAIFDPDYAKIITAMAKDKPSSMALSHFSDLAIYQAGRISALGTLTAIDRQRQE